MNVQNKQNTLGQFSLFFWYIHWSQEYLLSSHSFDQQSFSPSIVCIRINNIDTDITKNGDRSSNRKGIYHLRNQDTSTWVEWNTSFKWKKDFCSFLCYYLLSFLCYLLRKICGYVNGGKKGKFIPNYILGYKSKSCVK